MHALNFLQTVNYAILGIVVIETVNIIFLGINGVLLTLCLMTLSGIVGGTATKGIQHLCER